MLSPSRSSGFNGAGYIPLTEIAAYFEMFGIADIESRQEYLTLIRAMDAEYVEFSHEQNK